MNHTPTPRNPSDPLAQPKKNGLAQNREGGGAF